MSNSIYDYTIGGNVAANNLLYVKRQADDDFYTGLKIKTNLYCHYT